MQRIIKAAAIQLAPVLEDGTGTEEKVLASIAEAAARGVAIAVFSETLVPYYPYFSFVTAPALIGREHMRLYENAPSVPGPFTDAVAAAARAGGIVVVLGINERDHGSLFNTQLVFDADGRLLIKRRKITPSFHERMIWGQGDGAGLRVVGSKVGRIGALACWEHYNPLARYALMTQHEEIHCAQFPGSMVGQIFADQMEVTIRHHALEAGCFVINATGWLTDAQLHAITPDTAMHGALRGGTCSAIISPEGVHLAPPLLEGEGMVIADLDMSLIIKRKRMMDSVGHYARPELLSLRHDRREARTAQAGAHDPATQDRRSDQDASIGLSGSNPPGPFPADRAAISRDAAD